MELFSNETNQRTAFGYLLIGLAAVALLFVAVKTIHEIKMVATADRGEMPANTISVEGMGEVFGIPDTATFTFSVVEEGSTTAIAQEKATKKMNEAIEYLKAEGVEEKDIKTIAYNVYPKYEFSRTVCTEFNCPPSRQILIGYEVNQSISVKTKDTELAGELLTGLGSIGVSNVSGVQFTVDDEESLEREARKLAIEDARKKAELLAGDLDVRIVRIVNFYEQNGGMSMYYAKEMSIDGRGGANTAAQSAAPLPVGENKTVSHVTIVYEIR